MVTAFTALLAFAPYTVTPICPAGGFTATGSFQINRVGQISGQTIASNSVYGAFLWSPSSPNGTSGSLNLLPGGRGNRTEVHGLNNRGDVVGTIYQPQGSGPLATWKHIAAYWPYGGSAVTIGGSATQTEGEGINDAGEIAFFYNDSKYFGSAVSRVVSGKRKTYFLGSGSGWPTAINQSAQVLCYSAGQIWSPNAGKTAWSALATGLGMGMDLNDSGAATGTVGVSPPAEDVPAVFVPMAMYGLQPGTTNLFDQVIAGLPPYNWTANSNGGATGINNLGAIVGWLDANDGSGITFAWIRDPFSGAVSELTAEGYSHICPHDINDAGQIVATAISASDGITYCILLTP